MPLRPARMRLTGWGRYRQGVSLVVRPEKLSELKEVLDAGHRPILARGLGRSYGDAALNDGGIVVDLTRLNRILSFDRQSGKFCREAFFRRLFRGLNSSPWAERWRPIFTARIIIATHPSPHMSIPSAC